MPGSCGKSPCGRVVFTQRGEGLENDRPDVSIKVITPANGITHLADCYNALNDRSIEVVASDSDTSTKYSRRIAETTASS
jgi:hypothetical protein